MRKIFSISAFLILIFSIGFCVCAEKRYGKTEKSMKEQVIEAVEEIKIELNNSIDLLEDHKNIVTEIIFIYEAYRKELKVTNQIEAARYWVIECDKSIRRVKKVFTWIENPIEDPQYHSPEYIEYLKKRAQGIRDGIVEYYENYFQPHKKHLEQLKEKIKEFE